MAPTADLRSSMKSYYPFGLLGPASFKNCESCLMLYVMEKLEYKIGVPKRHANAKIRAPREAP